MYCKYPQIHYLITSQTLPVNHMHTAMYVHNVTQHHVKHATKQNNDPLVHIGSGNRAAMALHKF